MRVIHCVHPDDFKNYNTALIRERCLIHEIFNADKICMTYTHYDRMIVGGAMPVNETLKLGNYAVLKADCFLQRREMGIINVGGDALIVVDGKQFPLRKLDCLYIGKGSMDVQFMSINPQTPAALYLLSAGAHAVYPATLLKKDNAETNALGSPETGNQRTIYRYIHKDGIQSCQLVMGLTILEKGSVWNTMPPHTHDRRMEAYFYFDLAEDQVVFHYIGQPDETRHILMKNHQAVVSPPWSIHSGSGTSNYGFIWGMAGENLEYADMDVIQLKNLR